MSQTQYMQGLTDCELCYQEYGSLNVCSEMIDAFIKLDTNRRGKDLTSDYVKGYDDFIKNKRVRNEQ